MCLLVIVCVVLQEWIERYKDNRAAAAAELMTLLVQVRAYSYDQVSLRSSTGGSSLIGACTACSMQ
jgi:hypothetical protein